RVVERIGQRARDARRHETGNAARSAAQTAAKTAAQTAAETAPEAAQAAGPAKASTAKAAEAAAAKAALTAGELTRAGQRLHARVRGTEVGLRIDHQVRGGIDDAREDLQLLEVLVAGPLPERAVQVVRVQ